MFSINFPGPVNFSVLFFQKFFACANYGKKYEKFPPDTENMMLNIGFMFEV